MAEKTNEVAVKEKIKQFKTSNDMGYFRLDRIKVADRLTELVSHPTKFQQGVLSSCGPAAFFQLLIKRDALAFVQYATSLYNNGFGEIGNMLVKPGHHLQNQNYNEKVIQDMLMWMKIKNIQLTEKNKERFISPPADWMVMSSLRDESNLFLEYTGTRAEELAGITLLRDLKNWLEKTSLYQSVFVDASWVKQKEVHHAKSLTPSNQTDVILFINSRMLNKNLVAINSMNLTDIILNNFPNHYVVLTSKITETAESIKFSCWTWGKVMEYEVPHNVFKANYYGAIVAKI